MRPPDTPARRPGAGKSERFSALVLEGHKGLAFEVPFDPRVRWKVSEASLWPGRRGYRVRGTVNQLPFESAIVPRARRFFVLVTDDMKRRGRLREGATLEVSLEPIA